MSKSIEQLIGFQPLTNSLRATSQGVPNPFPRELFEVKKGNKKLGDRVKYVRYTGARTTAPVIKYGAPSVRKNLRDVATVDVRMLHAHMNASMPMELMAKLQSFTQYMPDEGMDWLKFQNDSFGRRIGNTEVVAVATTLAKGAIYINSSGQVLPTTSGSSETYSANIPANNQNQLNGIIATSWKNPNADIPGHLRQLRQQAAQDTGLPLKKAFYGLNIPTYFASNNFIEPYLARNPSGNKQWLENGEIPNGLFGFDWIPVYEAFFEQGDAGDGTGTKSTLWPADQVTFTPDFTQGDIVDEWWAMFEGSFPVPRSLNVSRDPMGVLANFTQEYGTFGYGEVSIDPPSITIHAGRTWLPAVRNEAALYLGTVVF